MKEKEYKIRAKSLAKAFASDNRGQNTMTSDTVGTIVGVFIGALVAAYLLPVAITEIVAIDTTSWSSGAASIWNIMDMIIVLALFLYLIGMAMRRGEGGL